MGGCPAKLPGTSGGSTCRNCRLRDGQPVQIGAADLAPLGLGVAAVRPTAAQADQPSHVIGVPLAVRLYQRDNVVYLHRVCRDSALCQTPAAQAAVTPPHLCPRPLPSGSITDARRRVGSGRSGRALRAQLAALVDAAAPLTRHQHAAATPRKKKDSPPERGRPVLPLSIWYHNKMLHSLKFRHKKAPANYPPGLLVIFGRRAASARRRPARCSLARSGLPLRPLP